MDEFPTDLPLPPRPLTADAEMPSALPQGLGMGLGSALGGHLGSGSRRPLSAQSRTSSNSTTAVGSRQVSKMKRRNSRGKNGLGRANSILSEASDIAAEQRYKRSLSRPCSAVSAEILARRNGLGTPSTEAETVTYMDPPLMHPRSVTPSAASMHESALHAGTKFKMPFSQARHLTARRLYQDSNHIGMARFNVQLPKTPNHRKLCVPTQPEGSRPRTHFPRGEAFGPRNLRKMFKNIDTDHSGSIDGLELIEVLRQDPSLIRLFKKLQGESLEDSASFRNLTDRDKVYIIKSLLHTGDADGNGTMEWAEFLEFFQRSRLFLEWKSRPDLNELSSDDGQGSEDTSDGEFGSGDEAEGAKRPTSPAQMGRRFSAATSAIFFNDPRTMNRRLAVSTFLRGGALPWQAKDSPWACLGNDWNAEQDRFEIEVSIKGKEAKHLCHCGQGAFLALLFPESAEELCRLAGPEARLRGQTLQDIAEVKREQENRNRPFYMSEKPVEVTTWGPKEAWPAMASVLRAKFAAGSECATALESTGDSFLLHRGEAEAEAGERETLWSDGGDGTGLNGVGLQLMVLRDELLRQDRWSNFLSDLFDLTTGEPKNPDAQDYWQSIVRTAGLGIAQHQRAVVRRASRSSGAGSVDAPPQDAAALRAALKKSRKASVRDGGGVSGMGSKFVGVGRLRPIRATIANVVELATAAAAANAARSLHQSEATDGRGEQRHSVSSSRKGGKFHRRSTSEMENMKSSRTGRTDDMEKRPSLLPGLKTQGSSALEPAPVPAASASAR